MKSWTTLKLGHIRSKTRSQGQILRKPCVRSRDHIFSPILMKPGQNVCLDDISDKNLKLGHVGSKTRSQGQILKKLCVCSRGLIFGPILINLGQNDCFDEILNEFEIVSCGIKKKVTRSNYGKTLCTLLRPNYHETWSEYLP